MSKPNRLYHYFNQFPPGTLITHGEIIDLFWRSDLDGGPTDAVRALWRHIDKTNRLYTDYALVPECKSGPNPGWRKLPKEQHHG